MPAASGYIDLDVGSTWTTEATATVTAAGCTASSRVEAWILPADTANHSIDEHIHESIKVIAHTPTSGSFQITLMVEVPPALSDFTAYLTYGVWRVGWAHD